MKGKQFTLDDVHDWGPDKVMAFLHFVDYFREENISKVTQDKVDALHKLPEDHPYYEFIQRANEEVARKFYFKMMVMCRTFVLYIRNNPDKVTEMMKPILAENNSLKNALNPIKNVAITAPAVERSLTMDTNVALSDIMIKSINVFDQILSSMTEEEIKKMRTESKFQALSKLAFVFTESRKVRPNVAVFQNIKNFNNVEDVEKALTDFATDNES